MGNLFPRLYHGAKVTPAKPSSTISNQLGRHLCLHLPLNWFQNMKKPMNALASGSTRGTTSKPHEPSGENRKKSEKMKKKKKGAIRVKVVLTKEEAAQLLAMCARGEERTAMRRLERLQACRQQLSRSRRWRPVLASIPEMSSSEEELLNQKMR